MFEKRYGFLFGSVAAEFASRYPLAESVARLHAVVSSSEFFLLRESAVGTVEADKVRLRCGGPCTNKTYGLRFIGAFHQENGVRLSGRFVVDGRGEVSRFIGNSIWESFLLFCLIGAFLRLSFIPVLIAGVFGGNFWGCRSSRRFVYLDVAWLSAVIKDALAG